MRKLSWRNESPALVGYVPEGVIADAKHRNSSPTGHIIIATHIPKYELQKNELLYQSSVLVFEKS